MIKKICLSIIALYIFCTASDPASAQGSSARKLLFFYAPGCHNCDRIREKAESVVEGHFSGQVVIEYVNISEIESYKMLVSLQKEKSWIGKTVFPVLYFEGRFIEGNKPATALKDEIAFLLKDAASRAQSPAQPPAPVDLAGHFKKFSPLVVMGAGLVDGINPCAFSAMVFFISFLTVHGYDKKRVMISGLAFIAASFVTYVLIGVGLLGSLYALKYFSVAARIFNISIGVLSIVFGIFSLHDAAHFARTGSMEGLILRLSASFKYKIQSAIGREYRVSQKGAVVQKKKTAAVLIGACSVGVVVSIFESACTGQVYLPTIMFVLNTAGESLRAAAYLLFYNIMFSVPLCAIFLFALAGATSQVFERFVRRNMVKIKVSMAIVFFMLGALLIIWYAPDVSGEAAQNAAIAPGPASQSQQPVKAQTPAKLVPDQYYWDFGTVREGAVLVHKFNIKNGTAQKFTITQINTSCSCTTSKLEKWELAPGESTMLEVTFNTKGYPGERQRFVYLHTDRVPEQMIMLEVRAEVK